MNTKLIYVWLLILLPIFLIAQSHQKDAATKHADELRVNINNSPFPTKAALLDSFYLSGNKWLYPKDELAWVDDAISYYSKPGRNDIERLFEYKKIRTYYYFRLSDFEKMTTEALEVIDAISAISHPSDKLRSTQAKMYLYLAGTLFTRRDSERSIALVEEALGLYRQLKDTFNIAHCLKGLAANYNELGDFENALSKCKRQLNYLKRSIIQTRLFLQNMDWVLFTFHLAIGRKQ